MPQGVFIVFEGLDGSGQSTQAKLLSDYLITKGKQVLITKEPTKESPIAAEIKKAISEKIKISSEKLQELFAKDRQWHIENIILPALNNGIYVLCDRYVFSSFAYGMASGVSAKKIEEMNKNYLKPNLVFFINTKSKISIERIEKRGQGIELFEKSATLKKVSKHYQTIFAKTYNFAVEIINGNKDIKNVFEQIKKHYKQYETKQYC